MEDRFVKSLSIFFETKYSLMFGILGSFIATVSMNLIWAEITNGAFFELSGSFFFCFLSFFLLSFVIRTSEVIHFFKCHLLHSEGKFKQMRVKDLRHILIGAFFIFIFVNLLTSKSYLLFGVLATYLLLYFADFFVKDLTKIFFVHFVSKIPINLIAIFYFISIFSMDQHLKYFTTMNILLALVFWLPTIAWEVVLRLKAPSCESDSPTFSKCLGPRAACVLPLCALYLQFFIAFQILGEITYSLFTAGILGCVLLLYTAYVGRFMITLKERDVKHLRHLTEAYILLTGFAVVTSCLL